MTRKLVETSRTCPFAGCGEPIDPARFACKRHWFSLSESQKQTIVAAYHDYRDEKIGVKELRAIQQKIIDVAQAPLFRGRRA